MENAPQFTGLLISRPRQFDVAAIEAVKGWRYVPARMHGRAVAVQATVMVEFIISR